MSLWRTLFGLLATAGLSWDDLKPAGQLPAHGHPFELPDTATLVQLAEALGGGIYPGMGSGQNDTVSAVDSVAPGFPLNMNFLLPANQVRLQAVRLSFQPQAFRTYYSATQHQHAGDVVQTLSITINNDSTIESVAHFHQIQANGLSGSADTLFFDTTVASRLSKNSVGTGQIISQTDIATGGQDHYHTHAHVNPTHGHTPGTTGANNPATGVQEGTSPDNMRVLVDGTDVTTQLGGPWSTAQTELDVTPYVAPGLGQHIIQVTTATNLGRVAGFVRHKAIVNSLSPAA